MYYLVLCLVHLSVVVECNQLLTLHDVATKSTADYPGCSQPNSVSCVRADINMHVLQEGQNLQLPDGSLLILSWRDEKSAVFKVL